MKSRLWWLAAVIWLVASASAFTMVAGADDASPPAAEGNFATENSRAMDKMMAAMAVETTGNVDRDFVATMVPHHQGAIDMALAELRFGTDETLRRMAQEIIVEQKQEIVAMQLAAAKLPASTAAGQSSADVCTSNSAPLPMHDTVVRESH